MADDYIYMKEQKEMKIQISEMISIISKLKDGLQRLTESRRHKSKSEDKNGIHHAVNSSEETSKDNSSMKGLALIQRLIDKDCTNSQLNAISKKLSVKNMRRKFPHKAILTDTGTVNEKIISIDDNSLLMKSGGNISIKSEDNKIERSDVCFPHVKIFISPKVSDVMNSNGAQSKHSPIQKGKYDLRSCAPERCPICRVSCIGKREYDQHIKVHYTKGTYDCALCSKALDTRDSLMQHFLLCFKELRRHCNLDKYTCPTCSSFYANQASLAKHKAYHSECRPFACVHCSFRYFSSSSLQLHVRNQHNPMSKYHCPLCDSSFLCNSFLFEHIAVHTGCRPFTCKVCSHKADSKKAIKRHILSHGEQKPNQLKCKECSYTCNGKYIMLKHRFTQHKKPVVCSSCGKRFLNPSAYKRHYDLHQIQNRLRCSFCLYETSFKQYLDKHMLIHLPSTKFSCPNCKVPLSSKHTISHHLHSYCKASLT